MFSNRTRKLPAARKSKTRRDGWSNVITGLGAIGADKRIGTNSWSPDLLPQEESEMIWRTSWQAARLVEKPVDTMLREGFHVVVNNDKDLSEEFETIHEELDTLEKIRRAMYFKRALGGAGIILGADDGAKDLEQPLDEDKIKSFDWLSVRTPRELIPVSYYSDPLHPRYGEVASYRLTPIYAPPGAAPSLPVLHESRIIRLGGAETTRRSTLYNVQPGWGDSVFVRALSVIEDFQSSWAGAALLMQEFAPATLKIKGLAKLIAQMAKDNPSLRARAEAIAFGRSMVGVTILDSEEEYERATTNVTGLAEMLQQMMIELAACFDMPVTLLFGQSPAGLNATGDNDVRGFYDTCRSMNTQQVSPIVRRITRLKMLSADGPTGRTEPTKGWKVKFPPLWQPTELERAQARKMQTDADVALVDAGILTPEEVRESRFGGDEFSYETHLDQASFDEMTAANEAQAELIAAAVPGTPGGKQPNGPPNGPPVSEKKIK